MSVQEWLQTHTGLWWWPAAGTVGLIDWLGINPASQTPSSRVCVIPKGAPLLGTLSPAAACRIYCALKGIASTPAMIFTQLRMLEIPDAYVEKSIRHLELVHRVQTWLAMARLAEADVVVLGEPLAGALFRHQRQVSRLLHEAAAEHRHIFVVTPHPEAAAAVGALQKPPMDRLVR